MGKLLNLLSARLEKRSVSDPNHWIVKLTQSLSTKSGVNVTAETALNVATVFSCVRVISEEIASLPLMLYQRRADGGKDVATGHYLYSILHDSPNTYQTKFEFFEMSSGHLCLRGNCFAFISRERSGRIKALVPLNPARMEIETDGTYEAPVITYRYRAEGDEPEIVFSADEIWHTKGLSSDGFIGLSPLALARESIGLASAAESHGATFFRNGAQPSVIATTPGKLHEDTRARLKSSIQDAISGENKFKVLLLEQGLDAKSVGMTNADSQFLETRQFQVEEICRIFRVPPILVGHSNNTSTYASAEQFMLSFVTHTLRPWCSRIEQSINKYLLSEPDRRAGYFAEFKLESLLRGDTQSRYTAYASALQNMWLSRNEVRALENLNPVEGGDKYENPAITVKPDGMQQQKKTEKGETSQKGQ